MRLKEKYETIKLDDEIIAVPVGESAGSFHGVVKLNETAAFIFNLLQEEISNEAIIAAMEKEYNTSREQLLGDVEKCIAGFYEKGLINI